MRCTTSVSLGPFAAASASLILAIASRWRPALARACASCSGFPTSGRTASPFAWACASNEAAAPRSSAAHRTARRECMRVIADSPELVEELLGADQPDLGNAVALRGRHDARHVLVGDKLVGAQVEFRLRGHGGRVLEGRLQRRTGGAGLAS